MSAATVPVAADSTGAAADGGVDIAIVGAGPCGLAAAIAAKRAGLAAIVFDRSCVVSGIAGYPTYMTFFSTAERLSIGGVPFVVAGEKPTRRDALAYYRAVVDHFDLQVRQYEAVERVERLERAGSEAGGIARGAPPTETMPPACSARAIDLPRSGARFRIHSRTRAGAEQVTSAGAVVIATGYFGVPNRLGVPGEHLPHVSHEYREGHFAFRRRAVVVGGGNSAVDAALDMQRSGAHVTLVHFGSTFDRNIKPWLLPDVTNRVADGSLGARWDSRVREITPTEVVLGTPRGEESIPADHVFLLVGYLPETTLLADLGVRISPETGIPDHDRATMETSQPGVFIAGVIASGYDANKTFIENGRFHGDLIADAVLAASR